MLTYVNYKDNNVQFAKSGLVSNIYLPGWKLCMDLDKCNIEIPPQMINLFGGYVSFVYKDDRFMVDDGFRNNLLDSGYLVFDNYDTKRFSGTSDEGIKMREQKLYMIYNILDSLLSDMFPDSATTKDEKAECSFGFSTPQEIVINISTSNYKYTVLIDTVNYIVYKNQKRREMGLTFYKFNKKMDKYGTFYVSIFCKRKVCGTEVPSTLFDSSVQKDVRNIPNKILEMLDDTKFIRMFNYNKHSIKLDDSKDGNLL